MSEAAEDASSLATAAETGCRAARPPAASGRTRAGTGSTAASGTSGTRNLGASETGRPGAFERFSGSPESMATNAGRDLGWTKNLVRWRLAASGNEPKVLSELSLKPPQRTSLQGLNF